MQVAPGTRLGPYEILAPLGAGGMGEVYRARDTRLDRTVAIKILPTAFASDAERLQRFEQEARAIAALNHPNILAIHDVGSYNGCPYLVSEFLEGTTLHHRLNEGALSPRKAAELALQMARGLGAAHDRGIVHRDLKPENVFLTRDGNLKILDFGLAKLARPEVSPGGEETLATAASPATTPGIVMGTAGYMSPEQVRGMAADHRSDIFSFGAILYEMLAGGRAFQRDTSVETMTAILKEEPPELVESGRAIPPAVDRIVRRCLEKEPEQRFQSAKDLAFALEAVSGTSGPTAALPPGAAPRFLPFIRTAFVAGAVCVVVATAAYFLGRGRASPVPELRRLTFSRGYVRMARFTSDGQTVAFGGMWNGEPMRLCFQRTDSAEFSPLALPEADLLSISSSGELAIALRRKFSEFHVPVGTLARVPLTGGAPREVLEGVTDADWSPDGSGLAVARGVGGRFRLEYPIGKVLYETAGYISHIRFSPRNDLIAFMDHPIFGDDRGFVSVVDLSGKRKVLTREWESEQGLAWSPRGDEIWFAADERGEDRALRAVSRSGRERVVLTAPIQLTLHDISRDGRVLLAAEKHRADVAVGAFAGEKERDLTWFDNSFKHSLADDGSFLAFNTNAVGGTDYGIFLRKTDGSPALRLGEGLLLAVSHDGKWALATLPSADDKLFIIPTGPGETRSLAPGKLHYRTAFWLPDGKRILAVAVESGHEIRTYLQDLSGGEPKPVSPEGVQATVVSPDGKAFIGRSADEKTRIYFVEGGQPQEVRGLEPGDIVVQWLQDGRTLLVRGAPSEVPIHVSRLDLQTGKKTLWKQVVRGDKVGLIAVRSFLVTPDGSRYAHVNIRRFTDLYVVEGLK